MRPSPLYAVNGVPGRDCTACGAWKPVGEFYKSAHEKTGITQRCKVCILARQSRNKDAKSCYDRARYEQSRVLVIARGRAWYVANQARKLAYDRHRYRANPQYAREKGRAWRKAHPGARRGEGWLRRHAPGRFTKADVAAMYQVQEGHCYYCGDGLGMFQVEHKTPIARGGTHWPDNLALSCVPCNKRKGTKTEAEFRAIRAYSTG